MQRLVIATILFLTLAPTSAVAFPFGGQAGLVHRCFNQAIYIVLGPPRGGAYVWTPATAKATYQLGLPSHAGQWFLGLASPPYYCLYSIEPIIVTPAIAIIMMGSSR